MEKSCGGGKNKCIDYNVYWNGYIFVFNSKLTNTIASTFFTLILIFVLKIKFLWKILKNVSAYITLVAILCIQKITFIKLFVFVLNVYIQTIPIFAFI